MTVTNLYYNRIYIFDNEHSNFKNSSSPYRAYNTHRLNSLNHFNYTRQLWWLIAYNYCRKQSQNHFFRLSTSTLHLAERTRALDKTHFMSIVNFIKLTRVFSSTNGDMKHLWHRSFVSSKTLFIIFPLINNKQLNCMEFRLLRRWRISIKSISCCFFFVRFYHCFIVTLLLLL